VLFVRDALLRCVILSLRHISGLCDLNSTEHHYYVVRSIYEAIALIIRTRGTSSETNKHAALVDTHSRDVKPALEVLIVCVF
jgi:hypothetical protein